MSTRSVRRSRPVIRRVYRATYSVAATAVCPDRYMTESSDGATVAAVKIAPMTARVARHFVEGVGLGTTLLMVCTAAATIVVLKFRFFWTVAVKGDVNTKKRYVNASNGFGSSSSLLVGQTKGSTINYRLIERKSL